MANVKFDDYLNNELKNNDFKKGYLTEKAILESALTVAHARQSAGLSQRQPAKNLQSALVNIIGGVTMCNSTYCIFLSLTAKRPEPRIYQGFQTFFNS